MARLVWAELASRDVDEIYDYIGRSEGRPATADKFIRELHRQCAKYADAFATGSVLGTARDDLGEGYRVFSHKRWIVIFRPIAEGLEVLRIVDGSRDYAHLFG